MMQDIEKIAVAARCTKSECRFNGIVLIPRDKSKEESLKNEKCPLCDNIDCLQLVSF